MKLLWVKISHFKNILESGTVKIEGDVTCLVGKNESGKTAFLQALHRFNPVQPNVSFSAQRHFPAWLEKQHRRLRNLEDGTPVTAHFLLDEPEWEAVEKCLGPGALKSREITIFRTYSNEFKWEPDVNEYIVVAHIVGTIQIGDIAVPTTVAELDRTIQQLRSPPYESEAKTKRARQLAEELAASRARAFNGESNFKKALWSILEPYIPKFFYFDEYSQLPGSTKIRALLAEDKKSLSSSELTARSLLELAGADNEYLFNPDYETRKRELENIANAITHDVLAYWSTNPELRTDIDITMMGEAGPNGYQQVLDELKIRLYDNRHLLSLGFEERSTGFRWFFSFLAAFSAYAHDKAPVVILLDEPGLGLHALAQKDFLRFIDERLSKRCQVVYSTHSPFMVQPGKLERVRLVQDGGRDTGSRVTDDVLSADRDTLFPLQGALGYDMAQHLFIAPHSLIVEGASDFTYLSLMSGYLNELGRIGLDPKWSIVPVGGANLIPTFVALLGNRPQVTVLVDSRNEGHQCLLQLAPQGILKGTKLISIAEIIDSHAGDIEDLFSSDDYLWLFNTAFRTSFPSEELVDSDPIVERCARLIEAERYDRNEPATVLLRDRIDVLPSLSHDTLDRFELLFQRVNATLGI